VVHTGYRSDPTVEFTWALILACARHIVTESNSLRSGGWQQTVGADLVGFGEITIDLLEARFLQLAMISIPLDAESEPIVARRKSHNFLEHSSERSIVLISNLPGNFLQG
jgi:phosphoglycerate dehydrogenase-like enzyme